MVGVPTYYGPPPGVFGPGYHGFGLDYGCERRCFPRFHNPQEPTPGCWASYVLGKECLDPYVADPYSGPRALGFSAALLGAGGGLRVRDRQPGPVIIPGALPAGSPPFIHCWTPRGQNLQNG